MTRIFMKTLFSVFVFFFVFTQFTAASMTYEWIDAQGTTHFTDDLPMVPSQYRKDVKEISLPEPSVPDKSPQVDQPSSNQKKDAEKKADAYETCKKQLEETKKKLEAQLASDRKNLEELTRGIHRTATTRYKSRMKRERVALKNRIAETEEKLQKELPLQKQECERRRD